MPSNTTTIGEDPYSTHTQIARQHNEGWEPYVVKTTQLIEAADDSVVPKGVYFVARDESHWFLRLNDGDRIATYPTEFVVLCWRPRMP
jgi:hypothetical protein